MEFNFVNISFGYIFFYILIVCYKNNVTIIMLPTYRSCTYYRNFFSILTWLYNGEGLVGRTTLMFMEIK